MLKIFKPGEIVYYPQLDNPISQKPMKVEGGRIVKYPSGKFFIKYVIKGHNEEIIRDQDGKEVEVQGLLDRVAEDVRGRISDEYDSIITIVGDVGTGKSNLGVHIAELCDPTFNLKERYVYDFLPFLEKLKSDWDDLKPGMCFLMDEATNLANNRNWNNDVNKFFTQFLEMFRSLGLILILIIPTKQRLDVYLREGARTSHFLEALDLKDCGKYSGRGYCDVNVMEGGREIYVGMATFPKMNTDVIDDYVALKKASQKDKLDEMIKALSPPVPKDEQNTQSNRSKKDMALWFIIREGWSYKEVSERFGVPEGTLRRWMKEHRDSL